MASVSCSKKIDEQEPKNNDIHKAQKIESNEEITATLYSSNGIDKDYYEISIEKEFAISATLTQIKGIDTYISIYSNPESEPIKTIDDNRASLGESFAPIRILPPRAIILISSRTPVNSEEYKKITYKLKINLFTPPKPLEEEPNDSFETATFMKEDHITGFYNSAFDNNQNIEKDFYKFSLTEEKRYRLKFSLSAVSSIDSDLRIYNEKKDLIKKIDEGSIGQGEEFSSLGIDGPQDLYIQIYAKDRKHNIQEYYEFKIDKTFHKNDQEFEPNDSFEKASKISEEETSADISDKNDKDFFIFTNTKEWPRKYIIEAIPDGLLDLKLEIFSDKKELLYTFNDSKADEKEGVSNFILEAQKNAYLKVSSVNSNSLKSIEYKIKIREEEIVEFHEKENNNKPNLANEIQLSSNFIGYINPNLDNDFFKPNIEKKDKYKINLDGIKNCKLKLDTTDKSGSLVNSKLATNFGQSIELNAILSKESLIRITCAQSKDNLFKYPYTLLITKEKE